MKLILSGDEKVKKILKGLPLLHLQGDYRPLKYCIITPTEGGELLYNQITKELLFFEKHEYLEWLQTDEAIEHWCSAPENFDERELVIKIRDVLSDRPIIPKEITLYHIFTTTSCNARCYYCFEKGNQKCGTMNVETADKLVDYILEHRPEHEQVMLAWFGGEPLLNTKVIDQVCGKLNKTSLDYCSIMATNASLINDDILAHAKNIWKLCTWNITLDGTENIYNDTKSYTHSEESPFRTVIRNIHSILNSGFHVNIRLNIGIENGDDLLQLVDWLKVEFGNHPNLCVYGATLYERQLEELQPRTSEEEAIVREKELELFRRTFDLDFYRPRLRQEFRIYRCNPDMGWAISVLPDGRIGWCEDYVDKKIISSLDSKDFDEKIISNFRERCEELPECKECVCYPDCIRLKMCDIDTPWCTLEKRNSMEEKIKISMQYEYQLFLNRR